MNFFEKFVNELKIFHTKKIFFSEYPIWNYDGSSCGQSSGLNSDLYLKPVAHYPDPFLGGQNRLVLCETLNHLNEPTS